MSDMVVCMLKEIELQPSVGYSYIDTNDYYVSAWIYIGLDLFLTLTLDVGIDFVYNIFF
jgi:hypothetical protein